MVKRSELAEVVLAISAFRSDTSVIGLLQALFGQGATNFGKIIVVDSHGSGEIELAIARGRWPVEYHNSPFNLGSAGNLARRLDIAASSGLGWCFAVNHDGIVRPDLIENLLSHAADSERIGAIYPSLVYSSAGGKTDLPRLGFDPFSRFGELQTETFDLTDVAWSSSNCALYNLNATRAGVTVWDDLWMGWEDLAYGWQLQTAGWRQVLSSRQSVADSYEYRKVTFLGRKIYIAEKPPWYSYYLVRNLLLIRHRSRGSAVGILTICTRFLVESAVTILYRSNKLLRFKLLASGIIDGLKGISGKGPLP